MNLRLYDGICEVSCEFACGLSMAHRGREHLGDIPCCVFVF